MKICIIDNEQKELKKLNEYIYRTFKDKDKLNNIKTKLVFLQSNSNTEIKNYTSEEQKDRIVKVLEDEWKDNDVFLIDVAMLGTPLEKPIVSIEAVRAFLEKHPDYKKEYQVNKFIVFVTNHWISHIEFLGEKDFIQKIIKINKEDFEAHNRNKELCPCLRYCLIAYDETVTECDSNLCLMEVIYSIYEKVGV